jgi:hypothetical protein
MGTYIAMDHTSFMKKKKGKKWITQGGRRIDLDGSTYRGMEHQNCGGVPLLVGFLVMARLHKHHILTNNDATL